MYDGREKSEWNRMALLVTKLHNVNCVKRSEMIHFEDVHPYLIEERDRRRRREPTKEELEFLKRVVENMKRQGI